MKLWIAPPPGDCKPDLPCLGKHVEESDTFYVDITPRLIGSETVSSVTSVTPVDATLTATSQTVLTGSTTLTENRRDFDGNTSSVSYVIAANKGMSVSLAGGATGSGCSVITIKYAKSTGKTDAFDVHIAVHGEDV